MFLRHKTNNIAEVASRWQALACIQHQLMLVRRMLKNGSSAIVQQCSTCGIQVGSAVKRLPEHDALPIFDTTIQVAYSKRRHQQWREINRELDSKAREEWKREYHDYLLTPQWTALRDLVLQRENHLCQGCRKERATQAHHTTYQNVGHEFLFELVALCRPCHERFHQVYEAAVDTGLESYDYPEQDEL